MALNFCSEQNAISHSVRQSLTDVCADLPHKIDVGQLSLSSMQNKLTFVYCAYLDRPVCLLIFIKVFTAIIRTKILL